MRTSVVIPWAGGCPYRRRALIWVMQRYVETMSSIEIVLGASPEGPFNRAAAILDGARRAKGDVLVVSDADVYCDPTEAISHVDDVGWSIPHLRIHRLSRESTELVHAGADWHGLPLSTDNNQDRRPYKGNETGTLFVIRRHILEDVPPDVRFIGWGQEDEAYGDRRAHV